MTQEPIHITPSQVIEYLFCPRFIYYMNYLKIPQREEKRFKVLQGRKVHDKISKRNKNYLRKKIGCIDKEIEVHLASKNLNLRGEVDELLTLDDGTMAPLDYKYAEFSKGIYRTLKYQSVLYGLMIEENYECSVERGYICYIRSNNLLKEVELTTRMRNNAKDYIDEVLKIINQGYYPKATSYKKRCSDCTFRNICIE